MVIIRGKDALTDGYVVHDGVMKQKEIWKDLVPGDFALTEALVTSRRGPTCWSGTAKYERPRKRIV